MLMSGRGCESKRERRESESKRKRERHIVCVCVIEGDFKGLLLVHLKLTLVAISFRMTSLKFVSSFLSGTWPQ